MGGHLDLLAGRGIVERDVGEKAFVAAHEAAAAERIGKAHRFGGTCGAPATVAGAADAVKPPPGAADGAQLACLTEEQTRRVGGKATVTRVPRPSLLSM